MADDDEVDVLTAGGVQQFVHGVAPGHHRPVADPGVAQRLAPLVLHEAPGLGAAPQQPGAGHAQPVDDVLGGLADEGRAHHMNGDHLAAVPHGVGRPAFGGRRRRRPVDPHENPIQFHETFISYCDAL